MVFDKIKRWLQGEHKKTRFSAPTDEPQETLVQIPGPGKEARIRYWSEDEVANGPQNEEIVAVNNEWLGSDQTLRRTYIVRDGRPVYVEHTSSDTPTFSDIADAYIHNGQVHQSSKPGIIKFVPAPRIYVRKK